MIRSIDKIDDVKMEFSVQITFRWIKFPINQCNRSENQTKITIYLTQTQDSQWNADENQAKVVWRPVAICSQSELWDEGQDQIPDHYWARQGNSQSFSRKLCFFLKVMVFYDILQIVCISTWMAPTQVWMPDTFFRNERFGRMHNVLVPNLYVRIYADGTVLFR